MDSRSQNLKLLGKIIGIGSLSIGLNVLITKLLTAPSKQESIRDLQAHIDGESYKLKEHRFKRRSSKLEPASQKELSEWTQLQIPRGDPSDTLTEELRQMSLVTCEVVRVRNLILDLELMHSKPIPCPLIAHKVKKLKQQPFLMESSLVPPCAFIMKNCMFRSGQSIQFERKFLRAGPRATQFFKPEQVRADVLSLGDICPGINTVIRQITLLLTEVYKVKRVTGVKKSFEGFYKNDMLELTPQLVETIHHSGGCFLGTCKSQFYPDKIIQSMVERGTNQLYLIGAYHTLVSAQILYQEIKKRKLPIVLCVVVKAYNKDIPIFDNVFGFQSAIEETQRFVEAGFVAGYSYSNCVTMVKVPGFNAGFLAMDACRAARNVNICLVPQFAYDINGQRGLLEYIMDRIKHRGSCKIVYSQGAALSARDLSLETLNAIREDMIKNPGSNMYALLLKQKIENQLSKRQFNPHKVILYDAISTVKAVPANSLDTKLCCQLAHASIHGLMCGYTNFVAGHLGEKNAWVPISEMLSEHYSRALQSHDEDWQRLIAETGQPTFINDQHQANK